MEIVITIALVILVAFLMNCYEDYKINKTKLSFKETMRLAQLPVVTFINNKKEFNFLLDTGATNSVINKADLKEMQYIEKEGDGTIFGMDGVVSEVTYVDINLEHKKNSYLETFQVVDMSVPFDNIFRSNHIVINGILGESFLGKNNFVVDLANLIAYVNSKSKTKQ